jgi:hypothetical protein
LNSLAEREFVNLSVSYVNSHSESIDRVGRVLGFLSVEMEMEMTVLGGDELLGDLHLRK